MTISEALKVLDECNWLKVNTSHVSAARYHSRTHLAFQSREELLKPDSMYFANVLIRRKKGETFEGMLVRAATLVEAGHLPKERVPPASHKDVCACGENARLSWHYQLKQRVCPRCSLKWDTAARNNDMRPTTGEVQ